MSEPRGWGEVERDGEGNIARPTRKVSFDEDTGAGLALRTLTERFMSKVEVTSDGCWRFRGTTRYPTFSIANRSFSAHRIAHELFIGPIPPGHEVDHLCKLTQCVNPAHLEAVLPVINTRRSNNPAGVNSRKTHCIHGHAFKGANLYVNPRTGMRQCRACLRSKDHRIRARRRRAVA